MTNEEIIRKYINEGDLVTYTVCMGCLGEMYFIEWEGKWLNGLPTGETIKYDISGLYVVDDVHPNNVTHINRVPLNSIHLTK